MPMYEDEFVDGPSFEIIGCIAQGLLPKLAKSYDPDAGFSIELEEAIAACPSFDRQIRLEVARALPFAESPIEKFILPWLVAQEYENTLYEPSVLLPAQLATLEYGIVAVVPQLQIGRFRVDFALARWNQASEMKLVIVECDGAEFHKGEENEARDRTRDAVLTADPRVLGIIRISGREIHHDPCAAAQLAAAAFGWFWRAETR